MSDRDRRRDRDPRDGRDPGSPAAPRPWPDEDVAPGSSVFGTPAAPRRTDPYASDRGPPPDWQDRSVYPPPGPAPGPPPHTQPHRQDRSVYPPPGPAPGPPPHTQPHPTEAWSPGQTAGPGAWPDTRAPTDPRRGPGGPPAGAPRRAPGGPPAGAPRGAPGPRGRGRAPGRPAPEGGRGLPFGVGTLVGVAGLVCFLLGLAVLPWFEAAGRDVGLADIRTAFTLPETRPEDLLPDQGTDPGTTLPDGIPSPDAVADAVEQRVRDEATSAAAAAAATAIDTGKARYLELYAGTLWVPVAGAAVFAVVFSTVLAPRSFALSLLLGFRRLAGFVTVLAGAAHGAALWIVFTGAGAPEPAPGVWLGVGGLAGILLGCILGPGR